MTSKRKQEKMGLEEYLQGMVDIVSGILRMKTKNFKAIVNRRFRRGLASAKVWKYIKTGKREIHFNESVKWKEDGETVITIIHELAHFEQVDEAIREIGTNDINGIKSYVKSKGWKRDGFQAAWHGRLFTKYYKKLMKKYVDVLNRKL